jgi:hypothetical protein
MINLFHITLALEVYFVNAAEQKELVGDELRGFLVADPTQLFEKCV